MEKINKNYDMFVRNNNDNLLRIAQFRTKCVPHESRLSKQLV